MKRIIYLAVIALLVGTNTGYAQKKQTSDYNYRKAHELYEQDGDAEEIISLLDKQLSETPYHCKALMLRSLFHLYREKVNLALADVNTAIAHYNKKSAKMPIAALYLWRADIFLKALNDMDKALADCNMAHKLLKKEDADLLPTVLSGRAQLYRDLGMCDQAEADYRQLLAMDETNLNALINLAFLYMKQEKYDEALILTDKCEKFDAEYANTYRLRMQIHDKMGNADKAIDDAVRYFEYDEEAELSLCKPIFKKHLSYALAKVSGKISKTNDPYRWLMLRTVIHELRGDYAQAISDYDRVEQEYGAAAGIYGYRAKYYHELGDNDRAVADMTRRIEMYNGKDYFGILDRGDFYRAAGLYAEAIADFTCGIELEPTDVYPYYKRGWCYELSGDDDRAMADYNAGIDIDRAYPYIFLMRGELYLKRGDTEKAQADFEEVIRQDTVANGSSCRHYALHFLGRDAEAEAWMTQIIEQEPEDKGNWYDNACLLARMGRLAESLEALRRALELGYHSFAHIEHDDDMAPIRELPAFKMLIEEYRAKMAQTTALAGSDASDEREAIVSEIPMKKQRGGTYEVACTVNDLPLQFIFDTGASTVTISSVEASFMLKNGYLKTEDIKGRERFSTATGEIHEGSTIRLREIKIGDAVLRNVDASVVHNQQAPLLLGQSVLERFGIITIDNINSKLIIKQ